MCKKEIENRPLFKLITCNQDLCEICHLAQQQKIIALDTEFVRVRSYYPKLGLIQLYDGKHLSLIDPLQITDFSPLITLLTQPQILKVLHACNEDLEVFAHYFNVLPQPICDTQIMANFLDFNQSIGFAHLVQHYFALSLDKATSRTDWLARPLTVQQLGYAAADVWYLLPLYHKMQQQLAQTPWQAALEEDCQQLIAKHQQSKKMDLAYLSIAHSWKLEPAELMCLKLLAKWRQQEAIKRDLAVNFVVKAEHLWRVAKYQPKNISALLELGLSTQEVRLHGKKLLKLVEQAQQTDPQDYPEKIQRLADDPRYKTSLKQLQQKLKQITPASLKPEVIASRNSLEKLMKWHWNATKQASLPELLQGWRKEYGEQLLAVLHDANRLT